MKHEHYFPTVQSYIGDKEREVLQNLFCSTESLADSLWRDPDKSIREHYAPLLQQCERALKDAYAVLAR